jgi:hypothetical protein
MYLHRYYLTKNGYVELHDWQLLFNVIGNARNQENHTMATIAPINKYA